MRILVFPHDMNMGGSQLNAIEIAAAVRDLGHEVSIVGHPGSLQTRVSELDLEFVELPAPGRRPSPSVGKALRSLVRQRGIDIVHGYEWPPILEGILGVTSTTAQCVGTVLSMSVAPFIPTDFPLMVGTKQIMTAEKELGRSRLALMEPPVDTRLNAPDIDVDAAQEMQRYGLNVDALHLVMVNRLSHEMKLEGILTAIQVVGSLKTDRPVQLVIVGDGPARCEVDAAAREANEISGAQRVIVTGELEDPRWAYQIADITLGMGGSALRAMAFAKPLIVQGEQGFWQMLNEESQHQFLFNGWYGKGEGPQFGAQRLREQLLPLIDDEQLRLQQGQFGYELLQRRFSLHAAAKRQVEFYEGVITERRTTSSSKLRLAQSAFRFLGYKAQRLSSRITGTWTADDFNTKPTVVSHSSPGRAVSK